MLMREVGRNVCFMLVWWEPIGKRLVGSEVLMLIREVGTSVQWAMGDGVVCRFSWEKCVVW